ncbi:MAG: hypothetical protein QM756_12685 [Polyangiaceae bacterium]
MTNRNMLSSNPALLDKPCPWSARLPYDSIESMLTRSQVAGRLGKSIATVRRLEHVYLHPRRDAHGVHRFDPDEVERLATSLAHGKLGATGTPRSGDWKGWLARRMARGKRHEASKGPRKADHESQPYAIVMERELAELRRCTSALAELLLEVTTPSQRRRLGPEFMQTLVELTTR